MSAGFTPGPWESTGTEVVRKGDGDLLAEVYGHGEYENAENRQANANLIAAAPELYEALFDAAVTFRAYEQMHKAKGTAEGDMKASANAQKAEKYERALAKARGEQ